ncbi:helix-turn-helix transcriptional regulator, partial [Peptostreptococcus anaerobius]|uniref:helix-turn-helix transcriptional regulator n=1 Tax=Peptostreptococcus anaerobius TaxID=1261 RepID=UPI00321B69AD
MDFSFGTSLRNAREKRNYKREQIAEREEISPRFLAAIESGRRKPSLDVLIRLVNAIGASFDEILAPQVNADSEIVDRIMRLVPQCSQRDQELLLTPVDKMLDTKEKKSESSREEFLLPLTPRSVPFGTPRFNS